MGKVISIHLMARQHWLHWSDDELLHGAVGVDVARGPVLGDRTERTYFTGTDAPRVTNINKAIGSCNKAYPCDSLLLGVPAPQDTPTVTLTIPERDELEIVLDNPGAENGDTTGWTVVTGAFAVEDNTSATGVDAHTGDFFFTGGAAATTEAVQRVDTSQQPVNDGTELTLTWWQNGNGEDRARMRLEFRDDQLNLIGQSAAAEFLALDEWTERTVSAIAPQLAAFVDVVQEFEDGAGDGTAIAFIDDISLVRTDADFQTDLTSLDPWESDIGPDFAYIAVRDANDVGNLGSFNFRGIELGSRWKNTAYIQRQFNLDKSPRFEIEFFLVRQGPASPVHLRVGVNELGEGPVIYIGYTGGVSFGNHSDWRPLNGGEDIVERFLDAQIPTANNANGGGLKCKIIGEPTGSSTEYSLRFIIQTAHNGATIFDETVDEGLPLRGGRFGFNNHVGDQDTMRRFAVYDKFVARVAPAQPDAAEELFESDFTSYVYTFVNEFGEEGPQSPASRLIQKSADAIVTVGTGTTAPIGYGIVEKRVYRAVTDVDGSQFLRVEAIPLSQADLQDGRTDQRLGDPLISQTWDLPPVDMQGIVALPNGILMGFSGNDVIPSEQGRPHAFPVGYRLSTDYPIVGIGAIDASAIVVTEAHPYIVLGSSPDQLSMQKIELPQGCVSKRSITSLKGFGVIYASPDGLVAVAGTGQTDIITDQLMSRREWRALNPSSILGVAHDDRYFGFYEKADGTKGGFIIEVSGQNGFGFVPIETHAEAAYVDALTDTLYLVIEGEIHAWNEGDTKLTYNWRSPLYQLPYPASLAYAQVRAVDFNDITFRLYADGQLVLERAVTGPREFVVPAVDAASEWEVELEGTSRVQRFEVAQDPEEIS